MAIDAFLLYCLKRKRVTGAHKGYMTTLNCTLKHTDSIKTWNFLFQRKINTTNHMDCFKAKFYFLPHQTALFSVRTHSSGTANEWMHEDGFLPQTRTSWKGLRVYKYSTWVLAQNRCGDSNCYGRQDIRWPQKTRCSNQTETSLNRRSF